MSYSVIHRIEGYIYKVGMAIRNANAGESALPPEILNSSGFSTHKIKHLLNNLVDQDTDYLECGVLRGSTFISALHGNKFNSAFAVDNWSEFGGSEEEFKTICEHHGIKDFKTINKNCFALTPEDITKKINLYFYDAGHELDDQRKALTEMDKFLHDIFILIVDDYSWDKVRQGTESGIKEMNYHVWKHWYLFSEENRETEWWNGVYIAVINKNK